MWILFTKDLFRTTIEDLTGGRGGIRTHGDLATTFALQANALGHYATLPHFYMRIIPDGRKFPKHLEGVFYCFQM